MLLTFANDRLGDAGGYLRNIVQEQRRIEEALADVRDRLDIVVRVNVRIDDLFQLCARYNDDIVILHYGGHAEPDALIFEDNRGEPARARVRGLAERLGELPNLRLLFLNGCTTGPQVEAIRAHCDVPIIATDDAIVDDVACTFAHRFYDDLSEGLSIGRAYRTATSRMKVEFNAARDVVRSDSTRSSSGDKSGGIRNTFRAFRMLRPRAVRQGGWPWHLHAPPGRPETLDWRITAPANPPSANGRWRTVGLLAIVLLLTALGFGGRMLLDHDDRPAIAPPTDTAGSMTAVTADAVPEGIDPLDAPYPDTAFESLVARIASGEPAETVMDTIRDDRRWTLWDLVILPTADVRNAHRLRSALLDEGLRRLQGAPPNLETLSRYGRLLHAIDLLTDARNRPVEMAPPEATIARVTGALEAAWPAVDIAAMRGPIVRQQPMGDHHFGFGRTEVTNVQLRTFVSDFAEGVSPERPATGVDRFAATAFARRLGARLPTNAEWTAVTAALNRGGACREGDNAGLAAVGWFGGGETRPVGGRAPCGELFDLWGNAAEWLADIDPRQPTLGLTRGGSVVDPPETPKPSRQPADTRSDMIGFRLAMDLSPPPTAPPTATVRRPRSRPMPTPKPKAEAPPPPAETRLDLPDLDALEAQVGAALDPSECRCDDARRTIATIRRHDRARGLVLDRGYKETCKWVTGRCVGR